MSTLAPGFAALRRNSPQAAAMKGLPPGHPSIINVPNVVSLSGYAAAIAYLKGASPWWAIYSIAADEADGRIARATGQTSEYGSNLDWAIDLTLNGAFALKTNTLVSLPVVTAAQAYVRTAGWKTPFLSPRAILMLYHIGQNGWKPLKAGPVKDVAEASE